MYEGRKEGLKGRKEGKGDCKGEERRIEGSKNRERKKEGKCVGEEGRKE